MVHGLGTRWEDVVGLESAKTILLESLVHRDALMDFFGTFMEPWEGMLLYGPVGTGIASL